MQACCYSMCVGWLAHQRPMEPILWPHEMSLVHYHLYRTKSAPSSSGWHRATSSKKTSAVGSHANGHPSSCRDHPSGTAPLPGDDLLRVSFTRSDRPPLPLLLHRRAPFASLSPPRLRWPRLCLPLSSFLLLSPTATGLILLKLNRGKHSTYAGKIRATPATIFKSPAPMTHPPP